MTENPIPPAVEDDPLDGAELPVPDEDGDAEPLPHPDAPESGEDEDDEA